MVKKNLIAAFLLILFLFDYADAVDPGRLMEQVAAGGHVLMIRHAYAPGSGDPPDFKLGDCKTQRNLNDQGRRQAQQIGHWLRDQGLSMARIYSSQWCRCLETAKLIGIGTVLELPALNSFYDRPQNREPNLKALRRFLSKQATDGEVIVLVTHYVTIAGLTGEGVSSGEGVVLKLTTGGNIQLVGRLGFE